ncbi:MAG: HAD family hydrolase [Candidatus Thorarchaeota archaeon]
MDVFFDFHEVLSDRYAVSQNYRIYLANVLDPVGISPEEAFQIHDKAYNIWIGKIISLPDKFDDDGDNEKFMARYRKIDEEWEHYILDHIPQNQRENIKPLLKTSTVEYQALAQGGPILYSDVVPTLETLRTRLNLRLHVASSASSHHVKGGIDRHGIKDFFSTIVGYDTVRAPKRAKNTYYFEKLLEITDSIPQQSVFVGDSIEEAANSKAVGMHFIMVQRAKIHTSETRNRDLGIVSVSSLDMLVQLIPNLF